MSEQKAWKGHTAAILTILIWGTTFISTKVLLIGFTPVEILFFRFVMGFLVLLVVYPYPLKIKSPKQEILFAAAGLCGITLYYLLENVALTYALASYVGVIISVAPFFTAIFAHFFLDGEKLRVHFFLGFVISIIGICLISFHANSSFHMSVIGNVLALFAAMIWAVYSILSKKISSLEYNIIQTTRRTFFYGILFMIPELFLFGIRFELQRFINPVYLFNIFFLGVGASALCFVTWNIAVKRLGAVKTSIYIYLVPVITIVTSKLVLNEKLTVNALVGVVLTMLGLVISEGKMGKFIKNRIDNIQRWIYNANKEQN